MSLPFLPGETPEQHAARASDFLRVQGKLEAMSRRRLNKQEKREFNALFARAAALKSFGPDELNRRALNEVERQMGVKPTQFRPDLFTAEQRNEFRAWQHFLLETPETEFRVDTTGNPALASPSGFGSWVDIEDWLRLGLIRAMKAADPMLDPEVVSLIVDEGVGSHPLQLPWMSDIEQVASVIGEGQSESSANIANIGGALLHAFTYRTPAEQLSIEALNDLESGIPAIELLKEVLTDRYIRGLSADLVSGNGVSKPLGLVPSLLAMSQNAVGAVCQSTSTIALADLEALYFSVDSAYRNSDYACWLMNDSVALLVAKNEEISGNARLMSVKDGQLMLFDRPVYVAPSMDNHAPYNHHPILFGNTRYWVSRINYANQLRVIREAPGYVEKGIVAIKLFGRGGGVLAFPSDSNSNLPMKVLSSGPSV